MQIKSTLPLHRNSVNLNVMPLFHIHAISINLLASLLHGASCVAARVPRARMRVLAQRTAASQHTAAPQSAAVRSRSISRFARSRRAHAPSSF
jgi:acyl-CoA synthetase (AMP-forming)/AMP-acid ligase II